MGGADDCVELPEGLRGVVEERLEAGLNGLVTVENMSGQFLSCHFVVHRFFSVVLGVWDAWPFSRKKTLTDLSDYRTFFVSQIFVFRFSTRINQENLTKPNLALPIKQPNLTYHSLSK